VCTYAYEQICAHLKVLLLLEHFSKALGATLSDFAKVVDELLSSATKNIQPKK
jgi:hypothetical protein